MTLTMAAKQMDEVIQRWRVTPKKDLQPEDYELFLRVGRTCIAQGDSPQLLDFVKEEKNQPIVRSMGCGLLEPLVSEVLRKERSPVHCQAVTAHLLQNCNPNELLAALLERVKDTDLDAIADTVTLLLPPLQTVLLRLGGTKAPSVGEALDAVQKQVSRLPVPYTRELERDDLHGLGRCCTALLLFVQPFVEEVKRQDLTSPAATTQDSRLRTELLKFCMGSLRDPLLEAQLNREVDTPKNSPLWHFATEIMAILPAIQEPLPNLLFYRPLKGREDPVPPERDTGLPNESRACLAYLLFVQLIAMEMFPAVFSPVFVLQCNMEYINLLLSSKDESWLLKGLALYEKSLERVVDNSLPVELLELKYFYSVPQNLVVILTMCPFQHLRTKGLAVFQLFIDKLDGEAKCKFFRCKLKTSHHAGVEGYIIKNIKNQVEFNTKPGNEKKSAWFAGTWLTSLLREVLYLPQGPETDLLQGMDRIMESLNLLRYLLIREQQNPTGTWTELCQIGDNYMKPLRISLSLSRTYYTSQAKAMREEKKVQAKEAKEAKGSRSVQNMTVSNDTLSSMSPEAQYQVLQCALVTFDLMESLVARIEEITGKSKA